MRRTVYAFQSISEDEDYLILGFRKGYSNPYSTEWSKIYPCGGAVRVFLPAGLSDEETRRSLVAPKHIRMVMCREAEMALWDRLCKESLEDIEGVSDVDKRN